MDLPEIVDTTGGVRRWNPIPDPREKRKQSPPPVTNRDQKVQWLMNNKQVWCSVEIPTEYSIEAQLDMSIVAQLMKDAGLYSDSYFPNMWSIANLLKQCSETVTKELFSKLGD